MVRGMNPKEMVLNRLNPHSKLNHPYKDFVLLMQIFGKSGVDSLCTCTLTWNKLGVTPADLCLHTKVDVIPYTERDIYAEMRLDHTFWRWKGRKRWC